MQMDDMETKPGEDFEGNDDDEQKAKERIIQRREARRRKILENAKNRLDMLNGRTSTSDNSTAPNSAKYQRVKYEHFNGPNVNTSNGGEQFSDPEIDSPDMQRIRQLLRKPGAYGSEANSTQPSLFTRGEYEGNSMQRNDFEANNNPMDFFNLFAAPTPPAKKRHILFRSRLHLVLSAVICCILTLFWRENSYSIFIAPGLCVITDLLFFREPKPMNPLFSMGLMMLDERISAVAQKYFHLIVIVQTIIVDLGVFVFSYCTFLHLILLCSNNSFDDLIVIK